MRKFAILLTALACAAALAACGPFPRRENLFEREMRRAREQLEARTKSWKPGDPVHNVVVWLTKLEFETDDVTDINAFWQYTDDDAKVIVGNNTMKAYGLHVGVSNDKFSAQFDLIRRRSRTSGQTEHFINVLPGNWGTLHLTQSHTMRTADILYYRNGKLYQRPTYTTVPLGSVLKVRPQVGGSHIYLDIYPTYSKVAADNVNISYERLATKVRLRPGQSLMIGSMDQAGTSTASTFLSASSGTRTAKRMLLVVTVYIQ